MTKIVVLYTCAFLLASSFLLGCAPAAPAAKNAIAGADIASILTALQVYRIHTGAMPTTNQGLAALLMKPEPVIPIQSEDQQEFYNSYVHSPRSAAERIKRRYQKLEKRIQRLEHTVTRPEYDWENRLNS